MPSPSPPWNLPSFTVESTLSSSCFCSDPPLSCQGAALAHLDSLPLVIWYSGQTALFLFLLAKAAPAYLPTAVSVALRPLFPSQQAQYVQVLLLKPVTSLLLSDSRPVFTTLSSPSFLLPETFWQIWQKLSFLSGYNGFLDTRFSRGMMWLMSWPDGECTCTLCNSLLSLSSSLWYPLLSFLGLEAHCLI